VITPAAVLRSEEREGRSDVRKSNEGPEPADAAWLCLGHAIASPSASSIYYSKLNIEIMID